MTWEYENRPCDDDDADDDDDDGDGDGDDDGDDDDDGGDDDDDGDDDADDGDDGDDDDDDSDGSEEGGGEFGNMDMLKMMQMMGGGLRPEPTNEEVVVTKETDERCKECPTTGNTCEEQCKDGECKADESLIPGKNVD